MSENKCKDCINRENCAVVLDDWDKEFISYVQQSEHFIPKLETIDLIVEGCESYKKDENAEFEGLGLVLWQTIRLRNFMSLLELAKMNSEGWSMMSGGYALAEVEDIEVEDEGDEIIILVEHGKCDEEGEESYHQKFRLPMKALNNKKLSEKDLLKWLREY